MNDSFMSDRDPFTDDCATVAFEMDDGAILYIRVCADDNVIDIASKYRLIPNTGFRAKCNISHDRGSWRYECGRIDLGIA